MRRSEMLRALGALAVVPAALGAAEPVPLDLAASTEAYIEAKRVWRGRTVPPYVVYTLDRASFVNTKHDFRTTYRDRVWYRASDGAALTRRIADRSATGPLRLEYPAFDEAKDPGPPTVDLFALPLLDTGPSAVASNAAVIGHATVIAEYDYTVTAAVLEAAADGSIRFHLTVRAAREPDRNRLQEVWIDPADHTIDRVTVRDHLYLTDEKQRVTDVVPLTFDMRLADHDGVRIITRIDQRATRPDGALDTAVYRFTDVTFPSTLPAWYFDAATYPAKAKDAPTV